MPARSTLAILAPMTSGRSKAHFGTLSWASANHGEMRRREQLRQTASALGVLLSAAPGQLRAQLGWHRRDALRVDVDAIVFPDSKVALDAAAELRECSPARLVNHCHRMYCWGTILAQRDRLSPDPELLWVAAMLHDLCLTAKHRDSSDVPCFGARGGFLARDWALQRGWSEARSTALGDAISLHLNVRVGDRYETEARVLHAATGFDVMALRWPEVHRQTIEQVVARYPRGNWLETIPEFRAEGRPRTRARLLRRLGLFQFVRASPFRDRAAPRG